MVLVYFDTVLSILNVSWGEFMLPGIGRSPTLCDRAELCESGLVQPEALPGNVCISQSVIFTS